MLRDVQPTGSGHPDRRCTVTWLVEERVIWVLPSGEQRPGLIALGMPALVPGGDGEATCAYALDGLERGYGPAHGHGTFQALVLALGMIGFRLHDYLSRGVRVLYPDPKDEEDKNPDLATLRLFSLLGPLIREPGNPRGPADPGGKLAALESKLAEMTHKMAEERDAGEED